MAKSQETVIPRVYLYRIGTNLSRHNPLTPCPSNITRLIDRFFISNHPQICYIGTQMCQLVQWYTPFLPPLPVLRERAGVRAEKKLSSTIESCVASKPHQ
jgi:hypothetical protein